MLFGSSFKKKLQNEAKSSKVCSIATYLAPGKPFSSTPRSSTSTNRTGVKELVTLPKHHIEEEVKAEKKEVKHSCIPRVTPVLNMPLEISNSVHPLIQRLFPEKSQKEILLGGRPLEGNNTQSFHTKHVRLGNPLLIKPKTNRVSQTNKHELQRKIISVEGNRKHVGEGCHSTSTPQGGSIYKQHFSKREKRGLFSPNNKF